MGRNARAKPTELSTGSAADWLPADRSLPQLRAAAAGCRGCDLWTRGTQTVFGEGPPQARLLVVGEQPGDQEDLTGEPFVGPAGRLLDAALEEAGIDRGEVYITNAVKHFKWERGEKGKRRIHKKPNAAEITACRPWLDAEITAIRPRVILALGATAAQALLGRSFRVTAERGKPQASDLADAIVATVHPSSVLRAPTSAARAEARAALVADLRAVAKVLDGRDTGRIALRRHRARAAASTRGPASEKADAESAELRGGRGDRAVERARSRRKRN